MYITCQQCSTIFRLDERLLKPTGSKVRCSQCSTIFVEYPPAIEADEPAPAGVAAIQAEAELPSEAAIDQDLEGIDLDELDAIFEQGDMDETPDLPEVPDEQLAAPEDLSAAELDDDDLEMDFDLESDSEAGPTDNGAGTVVDTSDDDLDDLDLEMDFDIDADTPEEDQAVAEAIETDDALSEDLDLDLDDLDFSLDVDTAEAVVDAESTDDGTADELLDFDLDEDASVADAPELLLDEDTGMDPDDASEVADDLDDDIDLSDLDAVLGEDDLSDSARVDSEPATETPEALSEDDNDMVLEIDEAVDTPEPAAEAASDDFDLAELDDMLGGDDRSGQVSSGTARDVIDDEAELSLDEAPADEIGLDSAPEQVAEADSSETASEGLDLSDLDAMLDDVDGQSDQALSLTDEDALDADDELEDLDFELDAEFEDKPITELAAAEEAPAATAQGPEDEDPEDEEIDLSDIEQMLEGDDDALDTQQLEADFLGLDGDGSEKWAEGESPDIDLDDTDEIDLDEIEAAIDEVGSDPVEDTIRFEDTEDQELSLDDAASDEAPSTDEGDALELDLDDDLVLELDDDEPGDQTTELEADDELDLSDLDLGTEHDSTGDGEVIEAGDIELEFQVEDDEPVLDTETAPVAAAEAQKAARSFSIEDTVPAPQADDTVMETGSTAAPKPPKAKKSSSKGLVALLLALLLGGAGYLYYAVAYQGMNIPFVSQFLNPQPKDPAGILKLSTIEINSKFVDAEKSGSGRLFVIVGKVRNGYSVGRQMIRLQGKLFTKGKVLAKSEFAYAGVDISDEDLKNLPVADLKKKLNAGIAQGAATKVTPGGLLPFMVIFSELPDELDEFAIEVISSMPSS